jgi:hypothetical protein
MAAIGSTWASGTWVSVGGWAADTWADAVVPAVTTIDNDTNTAAAFGLAALTGSLWMNERLRAHCNTAYGTSEVEIQPLIARWLKDIKS